VSTVEVELVGAAQAEEAKVSTVEVELVLVQLMQPEVVL
jgi:hypothetical protein